jgi:hypothetical protein
MGKFRSESFETFFSNFLFEKILTFFFFLAMSASSIWALDG